MASQYKHLSVTEEDDSELHAGLLFYKQARIVAPVAIRQNLLQDVHGTCHVGVVKTYNGIWSLFWWPTIFSDVKKIVCRWLSDLPDVMRVNPHELVYHLLETIHQPREVVYLNILGPVTGIRLEYKIS